MVFQIDSIPAGTPEIRQQECCALEFDISDEASPIDINHQALVGVRDREDISSTEAPPALQQLWQHAMGERRGIPWRAPAALVIAAG